MRAPLLVVALAAACCPDPSVAAPEPHTSERERCEWRDASGATHVVVECWEHWAAVERRRAQLAREPARAAVPLDP